MAAASTAKPLELQWRMKMDNAMQGIAQPIYWLSYLIFWIRDAYDAKRRKWRAPLPPRSVNWTCGEGDAPALMARDALTYTGISHYIQWSIWHVGSGGQHYERSCTAIVSARQHDYAARNMRKLERGEPVARTLWGAAPKAKSPAEAWTTALGGLLGFDMSVPKAPRRKGGQPWDTPLPM